MTNNNENDLTPYVIDTSPEAERDLATSRQIGKEHDRARLLRPIKIAFKQAALMLRGNYAAETGIVKKFSLFQNPNATTDLNEYRVVFHTGNPKKVTFENSVTITTPTDIICLGGVFNKPISVRRNRSGEVSSIKIGRHKIRNMGKTH